MRVFTLLIATFLIISSYGVGTKDSTKLLRLEPLPSIFHTPETSWGFGVTLLGYLKPRDSLTKKSNFQVFLDATLMKQASFQTDFNFYTAKNKHFIIGSTDLSKFPEFYYGIGNENQPQDFCHIDIAFANLEAAIYTTVKNSWFVGPTVHVQHLSSKDKTIGQEEFQVDDMGYFTTGGGVSFLLDKRNNLLNPSTGYYVESSVSKYIDHTKNTRGFLNHSLDARFYHKFNRTIFNSNLYTVHNSGVVPFRLMPAIGGARFLRGYYAGRFRDNNMSLAQVELRRPLFWRVGIATFTGIAQVYSKPTAFAINRFHYNYGAGIRFKLNKHSEANIRLDYGRTRDSDGFYIVFGECF